MADDSVASSICRGAVTADVCQRNVVAVSTAQLSEWMPLSMMAAGPGAWRVVRDGGNCRQRGPQHLADRKEARKLK